MICLVNQETFLPGRQITRLSVDFEEQGGFTEPPPEQAETSEKGV